MTKFSLETPVFGDIKFMEIFADFVV